jgi:hypothetical protein
MTATVLEQIREHVNGNIVGFHRRRIELLEGLELINLLKKNPYLFRAKNMTTAAELIESLLSARLSSSEEKLFGDFLEDLAIFVASRTCDGRKSAAPGVDLEFARDGIHYLVSIKSGVNWGNSSQHSKLAQDLRDAVVRVKQSRFSANLQPVLGICYGKTRSTHMKRRGYLKVVGQNFWCLVSGNKELYTDIIEPIGHRAREHNDAFEKQRGAVVNRFTKQFVEDFCHPTGTIDWISLVEFNSGNYDLDLVLS